jgi:archaellum biogenesis ATPase FlaH
MKVSVFSNTWDITPIATSSIKSIFRTIQSEKFKSNVELIRKLKADEDKNYREEKKKLPAVTFSGVFTERNVSSLVDYGGILCVDIDSISQGQLLDLRVKLKDNKMVLGYFVSPSGDGLKVLLYSSAVSKEYHQAFYFSAEKYFRETYSVEIDRACKDVSRLCYISYDPEAYLASEVESFPIDFDIRPVEFFLKNSFPTTNTEIFNADVDRCFRTAKKWVERIFMYEDGQKNKYLHNLACSLNRLGVPMQTCVELIDANYITPDRKWLQSIESAYKHNAQQFNSVQLKNWNGDDLKPYEERPYKHGDVEKSIRRIIMRLFENRFPVDVIKPQAEVWIQVYRNFFDQEIIESEGISAVVEYLINEAQQEFKNNELLNINPIKAETIFDLGMGIEAMLSQPSDFSSGIDEEYDEQVPGLFSRGNVIGVIGREKTFKSVFVQNMAYKNAKAGLPGIYINGEMSTGQFIKRAVKIDSGVDFDYYLGKKEKIPTETYKTAMESLKSAVGKNLYVHSGLGFTRDGIHDLIKKLRHEGLDIGYVIVDGLSQMHQCKGEEIPSAIQNAMELKELAKEANVLVIVLIHMKSGIKKTVRDTGEYVRGGIKVTANFDAYFSTSLLEIQSVDDDLEPEFHKGVFCLRLNDKRGALDIITKIIEVKDLKLKTSDKQLSDYEF